MSTHATIEMMKDDVITGIFVHYDGMPEGVGRTLVECYNTKELVENLIFGGDIQSLGNTYEECDGRDEDDHSGYLEVGAKYNYLWTKGKWYMMLSGDVGIPLSFEDFSDILGYKVLSRME
jgi:hypothetical protein